MVWFCSRIDRFVSLLLTCLLDLGVGGNVGLLFVWFGVLDALLLSLQLFSICPFLLQ